MSQVFDKQNNLTTQTIVIGTDCDPTLRAIDVLGEGDLVVQDIEGNNATYTFNVTTLNTLLPYRLELRVKQVVTAGTTVAVGDLIGLH